MKIFFVTFVLTFSTFSFGTDRFGQLDSKDQQYFKNGQNDGANQWERTDKNVQEINKLHGELSALKSEVEQLKKDVEALKANRK